LWSRDDLAWLSAMNRILVNEEEGVPEVARFNAGQKFVFWSMALLVPVLFFTGLVIWEIYFSTYTSIEQQRIAALIHSLAAVAAIMVWIIHVYAAIWVRGSMRAMTRGYVTPGWAWRHHRKWLRRLASQQSGHQGPPA
jgi:formate dehydrogenase subunit gamma